MRYVGQMRCALAQRMATVRDRGSDRGDVPGWVLVTLMTAGLVAGLWVVAGPALEQLFVDALAGVQPRD